MLAWLLGPDDGSVDGSGGDGSGARSRDGSDTLHLVSDEDARKELAKDLMERLVAELRPSRLGDSSTPRNDTERAPQRQTPPPSSSPLNSSPTPPSPPLPTVQMDSRGLTAALRALVTWRARPTAALASELEALVLRNRGSKLQLDSSSTGMSIDLPSDPNLLLTVCQILGAATSSLSSPAASANATALQTSASIWRPSLDLMMEVRSAFSNLLLPSDGDGGRGSRPGFRGALARGGRGRGRRRQSSSTGGAGGSASRAHLPIGMLMPLLRALAALNNGSGEADDHVTSYPVASPPQRPFPDMLPTDSSPEMIKLALIESERRVSRAILAASYDSDGADRKLTEAVDAAACLAMLGLPSGSGGLIWHALETRICSRSIDPSGAEGRDEMVGSDEREGLPVGAEGRDEIVDSDEREELATGADESRPISDGGGSGVDERSNGARIPTLGAAQVAVLLHSTVQAGWAAPPLGLLAAFVRMVRDPRAQIRGFVPPGADGESSIVLPGDRRGVIHDPLIWLPFLRQPKTSTSLDTTVCKFWVPWQQYAALWHYCPRICCPSCTSTLSCTRCMMMRNVGFN